jgi:hypothetical protein
MKGERLSPQSVSAMIVFVVGILGGAYALFNLAAHVWGEDVRMPWLPPQVNTIILTVLGVAFLAAWQAYLRARYFARAEALAAERHRTIKAGLVQLGANLADNTGELRRLRGGGYEFVEPSTARLIAELDRDMRHLRPDGQ